MSWWKTAIYDTCSLITLDKLFQDHPTLSRWFPKEALAIEAGLSADQMYPDTAKRVKRFVSLCELPDPRELASLLSSAGLSKAMSDVDKLVFATAVHLGLPVVTGDKRLAKAIQQRGLLVGNVAMILQQLVKTKKLKASFVTQLLQALAEPVRDFFARYYFFPYEGYFKGTYTCLVYSRFTELGYEQGRSLYRYLKKRGFAFRQSSELIDDDDHIQEVDRIIGAE